MNNKLKDILNAINKSVPYVYSANDLKGALAYLELKDLPSEEQKQLLFELTELITELSIQQANVKNKYALNSDQFMFYGKNIAFAVQAGLLRKKLDYSEAEWIKLFRGFKNCMTTVAQFEGYYFSFHFFPINYAIKQIEYHLKKQDASPSLTAFIQEMLQWEEFNTTESRTYYGSDINKARKKLQSLINSKEMVLAFQLKAEDTMSQQLNQLIAGVDQHKTIFDQIFYLAADASAGKPSKKFIQAVQQYQDQIGLDRYKKMAQQLLAMLTTHTPYEKTITHQYNNEAYTYTETIFLPNPTQQFIKGMVWTMDRFSDQQTIRLLSKLCEKAYTKIPGKGPAAASIGNACVWVLGNMRGKDGLGALSRLKLKLRQNNVKKAIDKYLLAGAKKYKVSVEELKEMAVPDFQLTKGEKTIAFEDYQLRLFIDGKKLQQQWLKPDGTTMKTVPSLVKKNASLNKQLNQLRKEAKEIQKVYASQKQRIDNQFILNRSWDYAAFQKYYLQHGLVYPITRQLIWQFRRNEQSATGILLDEQWYTLDHERIDWLDEQTQVQLWHPIKADEASIIQWREKMMTLEWRQPIKQAFREIYLLTEAEVNTRNYSNRMAAHILKQHQFSSLANLRGWKYALMGAYDDGISNQICQKHLPEYNLTAEFWIDELNQDDSFNDAGIWYYVATDQVKFKNEAGEILNLVDIPQMVFTEIMRDVDLFVGVCSVGNDPLWVDNNGERQTNRDYWHAYSFGDLTEIAKTRKTILERLLPRLKKIRDKAKIDGKFLIVEGQLRTYKIHIGSGNILMEPNDQYLCIVPARSAESTTDRLFIPFEGDKGLSIVLSKAFLLAEDDKITDSTITSQINR